MLSNIFDELFSHFEKLDDRTCIDFENKLGYSELTLKLLIEQSKESKIRSIIRRSP